MIELGEEYKPFFYMASVLIALQIAFFMNFVSNPKVGWVFYFVILALSISVPTLVGACLSAILGFKKPMQYLLRYGIFAFFAWFVILLMSYSFSIALVFIFTSLITYKMLHYHHIDKKNDEKASVEN